MKEANICNSCGVNLMENGNEKSTEGTSGKTETSRE